MPRTTVQLKKIREERREALLEAARRVFVRKGLTEARMADIAAEAEASQGLLYHYFATKEAVYAELVGGAARGTLRLMAEAGDRSGEPVERLRWLVGEMLRGVAENREALLLIVQASTHEHVPAPVRAALEHMADGSRATVRGLIAAGQRRRPRQFAPGDAGELTEALLALIWGSGLALSRDRRAAAPSVDTVLRLVEA